MAHQGFVATATMRGIEAIPVTVEVSVGAGLPGITIVGMPDAAVQEARQRVKLALKASGYEVPNAHIVVNLAPGDLKKSGVGFDVPIAVGILRATGQISPQLCASSLFIGELSLDGRLRPIKGMLAYAQTAKEMGLSLCCAPAQDGFPVLEGVEYCCINSLASLRSKSFVQPTWGQATPEGPTDDFDEIVGQDLAKRALQIAAVGSLGVLMVGPPGAGKTMLAKRFGTILPPLSQEERIESALIHSVAGLPYGSILAGQRPFRNPHHSASAAGLLGGGRPLQPGEASLAHNGVLFLDELPEFGGRKLQMLRQPMEEGCITLARAEGTISFPARFSLLAAANPCPCGYYGDPEKECSCSGERISNYQARIGGPLLDRFDMCFNLWRCDPASVLKTGKGTSSQSMRRAVVKAREFAEGRPAPINQDRNQGSEEALIKSCSLDSKAQDTLETLARAYQLSGRGVMRALKVARAIADLDSSLSVQEQHLEEAIAYRSRGSL